MPITVGESVKDSAALSGSHASTASGTVTYSLYIGSSCSNKASQTSLVPVTSGTIPNSAPFVITTVGSYSLKAAYSGDASNRPSTSACEIPVTVNKATPTLTNAFTSPITASQSLTVTGTLTGADPTAHGTVIYQVFAGGTCSGTVVDTSTKQVINGVPQPSKAFSDFSTVGTYSIKSTYSGDQNDASATSSCGTLTVNKSSPTLSTTLLTKTIIAGQSVTDSAAFTAGTVSPNAGGTVTYTLYRDITCTTAVDTSTVTVTNGVVPNSKAFIINDATHTYAVEAAYSGDAENSAVTSSCEQPITVNKASPAVATQLSATSITATGSITDTATLNGSSGSNAAGSITLRMYTGGTCSGSVVLGPATASVSNNMVTFGPLSIPGQIAGSYSFYVTYSGDGSNNPATAPCEPFSVTPAVVSVITALSPTTGVQGGKVKDTATLVGATSSAGGSVTFTLFSGSTCSGTTIDTEVKGVVSDMAKYVTPIFNGGGTFSILAVYSGDANNLGATASCESFNVTSAPTITTTLLLSSINAGQTATDSAVLSGVTSNAGGTVTYEVFPTSAGTCTGVPIDTSQVTVTNGMVPNSNAFNDFNTVGTYYLQAVYSGDANNSGATSACENLTVNKAAVTISTQLAASQIFSDGTISDSATLAQETSGAGGTVTYQLYSDGTCTTAVLGQSDTETVVNGVVPPTSTPLTPGAPGTFSIQATYSGDANNNGATSACEVFTVVKHSPSLSTKLGAQSISFGGSMSDSATLTGASSTAGGSVTYSLYSNGACTGPVVPGQTDTETVTNGVVPSTSTPLTPNAPGTFGIQAVYSSDANDNPASSPCESFAVSAIAISTTPSATTVTTASPTISDSATLSGVTSNAGGTVTYQINAAANCGGALALPKVTVTVTNGVVPSSGSFDLSSLGLGNYGFTAVYSGDANNAGVTGSCEPFTFVKASPTLTTQLSASSISLGGKISDSATLTSASSTAGGTVTYNLYPNGACTGPIVPGQTDTETVTNGIVPSTSTPFTPGPSGGTYGVQATYSGDTNNNPATSTCESFTVSTVTISTTPSATTVTTAQTISDSATLGGVTSNAGGTVTYQINVAADCTGALALPKVTVTVTNGVVPSSGAFPLDTLGTGPYGFTAVYSGDANNAGVTGSCEPFTLVKASPTLTTQLSATSITVSQTVTDSATLTGASPNAGGTVKYREYSGGSCSGGAIKTDTETVTNGVVPTTSTFAFSSTGFYSFQAVYGGDAGNNGATSSCEQLTVNPDSPTLSTLLSATTIVHGGSVTDSSALSGATATAGGTVTITMYIGGSCSGTVEGSSGALTVTNGIVPTSGSFTAANVGTYSFLAVYSGDANNMPATASCEVLTAT